MDIFSLLKYYYICVPISKYISSTIIYYTCISPVFIPMTSNLIEKPINIIIHFITLVCNKNKIFSYFNSDK